MSATRTTPKELRALILRLDAELNDVGGSEQDRKEVLADLAATAKDINDEGNECDAVNAAILDAKAKKPPLLSQDAHRCSHLEVGDGPAPAKVLRMIRLYLAAQWGTSLTVKDARRIYKELQAFRQYLRDHPAQPRRK